MAKEEFKYRKRSQSLRIHALYVLPCFALLSTGITLVHHFAEKSPLPSQKYGRHLLLKEADIIPDCIPPALDSFPDDFFTQEERQMGGVVLHFLIVAYLCAMLAIVCDEYFVPSLEIISDSLKVPTDVAGATFMAIGTSSPELFSSIIGSFITEGDIGIGTIVGSAVFNILGVTSMAGIIVWKADVPIDWYPISRDCFVYAISVTALILVIFNNVVTWWESLIFLIMYGIYIIVMYYNVYIEKFSTKQLKRFQEKWLSEKKKEEREKEPLLGGQVYAPEVKDRPIMRTDPSRDSFSADFPVLRGQRSRQESEIIYENVKSMEDSIAEDGSICSMPLGGPLKQIWWVIMWPASLLYFITIPDCRKANLRKFFAVTFLMSVVWLGLLSYVAVWMVTIIGYTLGIPDTVSGITLLAAGTSIPEIISSIIVVRNGLGNMAICNLIGSNIFDILFCLGAPWFIKSLSSGDGYLVINSSALTYTTATLLITVVAIFVVFHVSGWKLNRGVGFTCLVLYAMFLVLACMYEMNVFGEFNPPPCNT